jgi:hypothetical protein
LNTGTVRINSRLAEEDDLRIDTNAAAIYLLGEGEFRIEAEDRGVTRVASHRGVAEVVGNEVSVLVRGGTRTEAVAGSAPDQPRPFSTYAADGFDRWCDARDDAYRAPSHSAEVDDEIVLPSEVQPYQSELAIHGNWTVVPDYGSVWYPTGVPAGWRPYNNGYWSYGPGGYFWVSYEPWGWAPYHYGNWQWIGSLGWCWIPGRVFAGAWVSWSWGAAYVGWAPLDYWGRPGWVGGPYYAGYYDPGCWTFVGYNNIYARNIPRYAVPIDTVRDDLRHATVVARPPSVDPRRIAQSPVVRDRALRLVASDQSAHMRPIRADQRPQRSLADVQNQMLRRPSTPSSTARPKSAASVPSTDRRTTVDRPRRIFEDPRVGPTRTTKPETRDDVRDLYQRMSRPRETRGKDASVSRDDVPGYRTQPSRTYDPRGAAPQRMESPRPQSSRAQSPRAQSPRQQSPRAQSPRAQSPRNEEAPRAQAPRGQSSRAQGSRGQAQPKGNAKGNPKGNPKQGDKH